MSDNTFESSQNWISRSWKGQSCDGRPGQTSQLRSVASSFLDRFLYLPWPFLCPCHQSCCSLHLECLFHLPAGAPIPPITQGSAKIAFSPFSTWKVTFGSKQIDFKVMIALFRLPGGVKVSTRRRTKGRRQPATNTSSTHSRCH